MNALEFALWFALAVMWGWLAFSYLSEVGK
jgi:hypothetical protein